MGPWYHEQWSSAEGTKLGNVKFGTNTSTQYQQEMIIPFFNHYLKDKKDPDLARATIFFTGENAWRTFDSWPASTVRDERIFLNVDYNLSVEVPKGVNQSDEYISDPAHPVPYTEIVHFNRSREYMTDDQRFASRRTDVLSYKTKILTEDLPVAGPVVADLRVSISTTDADFVVKIIDVFPDSLSAQRVDIYAQEEPARIYPMGGYQMLVRGEIFRGKYRKSFEKPEPFQPGKTDTVRFTLPDIAHTFKRGHRIMVQIQSSWFPLSDRNPQKFTNIYECNDDDFQKSNIRLFHDSQNPSSIILPVIGGKPE
jgi:putative CocE/NonD family hydrolase